MCCERNSGESSATHLQRAELTCLLQWLREWGVDIASGRPIELMKLVMRDWKTGEILNQYSLDDYEKTWGNVSRSSPSCSLSLLFAQI